MNGLDKTLRFRRTKTVFNSRQEAVDYIEKNRKSRYGEPIAARYRGEKNKIYTLLALGSAEYSAKNPNNRYQYFDPGDIENKIFNESEERTKNDGNIIAAVGLADDGTHKRSEGHYTSGRTYETLSGEERKLDSIEDEILVLDAELVRTNDKQLRDKENFIEAIGLAKDGTYKTIGYYYTKPAKSIAEGIKILDDKTHEIVEGIGEYGDPKTKKTVYGRIAKIKSDIDEKLRKIEGTLEFEDGNYSPCTKEDGTVYINEQNSIRDEIRALDFAIQRIADSIVEIHHNCCGDSDCGCIDDDKQEYDCSCFGICVPGEICVFCDDCNITVDVVTDDISVLLLLYGKVNVTMNYEVETITQTFVGEPLLFSIPPNSEYVISFSGAEEFFSPDDIHGVSKPGDMTVTGVYEYDAPPPYEEEYFSFKITSSSENSNTLYLLSYFYGFSPNVYVKINDGEWQNKVFNPTRDSNNTISGLTVGDIIKFKGINDNFNDIYFACNGQMSVDIEGNIMSLIYGDDFKDKISLPVDSNYTFSSLFSNQNEVEFVNAKNLILPAMELADGCYNSMFYHCTSLVSAPELPATKLADWCYNSMFHGCTNLVNAPELPATELVDYCYYDMFNGCTSLVNAPELPATNLATSCYNSMFRGCTNLVNAPELPATKLADWCYSLMFYECGRLTYVKCLATNISAIDCTFGWVSGVSSTGTFVKNVNMTRWSSGGDGIPSGWTVQDA